MKSMKHVCLPMVAMWVCAFGAVATAAEKEWTGASWVWDAGGTTAKTPQIFRRVVELKAAPTSGVALVDVDDNHRFFVNGRLAGQRTGWKEPGRYDIGKLLVTGKNVLAIEGIDTGGSAGAIAWVQIGTADGQTVTIATDKQWKTAAVKSGGMEWAKVDFDDSGWKEPVILGPAGMGPWHILGPNGEGAGTTAAGGRGRGSSTAARDADLTPAEQQASFTLPKDYTIELVAAEPTVINPVCMTLDEAGRIYVAESHTYRYGPSRSPVEKPTNPIVLLKPKPDGKGFDRVVVAEGFADPVMGMLVKDGKLWATACNYLYLFDLQPDGTATNRRVILEDKGKAWNPFGFFVIKWGPDGLLYFSVGNHGIQIEGPGGQKIGSRGSSGIVGRMKPDGSNIEVLTQGFRVPYSFDMDPYGQLWLLSNGEGNPNRFARVIEGVDYHCFSRTNEHEWLTGKNPLAPPAFELPRGANTSLLAYHDGAFPAAMQDTLLAVNWGPHGLGVVNHSIDLYVPDAKRNVAEPGAHWLSSTDSHFRPTTLLADQSGNLLLADFYNRDDESDRTGRIWRIRYAGADAAETGHKLTPTQWTSDAFAIDALGHPSRAMRAKAVDTLIARGTPVVDAVGRLAATAKEPVGAAMALWTLARIGTPESLAALSQGASHPDWKVRRLTALLARRYNSPAAEKIADALKNDSEPGVRVAAALARTELAAQRADLLAGLLANVSADRICRYEAAAALARVTDRATIDRLLRAESSDARLAGLITIDLAFYEKTPAAPAAREALVAALADPGPLDLELLLDLASMNRDPSLVPGIKGLLTRAGVAPPVIARAAILLQTLSADAHAGLGDAGKLAIAALREGKVPVKTDADRLAVLKLLRADGPSAYAADVIVQSSGKWNAVAREAGELARSFGDKAPPELVTGMWKHLSNATLDPQLRSDLLATVAAIEKEPDLKRWQTLLKPATGKNSSISFNRDVIRSWRKFAGKPAFTKALLDASPELLSTDAKLGEELAAVLPQVGATPEQIAALKLPQLPADEAALRKSVAAPRPGDAELGRHVFDRIGCSKCHSAGSDTRLGPPLAGVGQQTRDYLIESIFEPSKVIKTGFESEVVETKDGRTLSGLARDAGDKLIVINASAEETVAKSDITSRKVQKLSIMPEGLVKPLAPAELNDLLGYLQSLKSGPQGH